MNALEEEGSRTCIASDSQRSVVLGSGPGRWLGVAAQVSHRKLAVAGIVVSILQDLMLLRSKQSILALNVEKDASTRHDPDRPDGIFRDTQLVRWRGQTATQSVHMQRPGSKM
jgi:hypothetical protein